MLYIYFSICHIFHKHELAKTISPIIPLDVWVLFIATIPLSFLKPDIRNHANVMFCDCDKLSFFKDTAHCLKTYIYDLYWSRSNILGEKEMFTSSCSHFLWKSNNLCLKKKQQLHLCVNAAMFAPWFSLERWGIQFTGLGETLY